MSLLDFSPRIPLGTFSILLPKTKRRRSDPVQLKSLFESVRPNLGQFVAFFSNLYVGILVNSSHIGPNCLKLGQIDQSGTNWLKIGKTLPKLGRIGLGQFGFGTSWLVSSHFVPTQICTNQFVSLFESGRPNFRGGFSRGGGGGGGGAQGHVPPGSDSKHGYIHTIL